MNKFNISKAKQFGFKLPKKSWEEYDQEQLKMGIEVEHEHTSDSDIAAIITTNHLDEIPDYYTRLKKMEDEAKAPDKIAKEIEQ